MARGVHSQAAPRERTTRSGLRRDSGALPVGSFVPPCTRSTHPAGHIQLVFHAQRPKGRPSVNLRPFVTRDQRQVRTRFQTCCTRRRSSWPVLACERACTQSASKNACGISYEPPTWVDGRTCGFVCRVSHTSEQGHSRASGVEISLLLDTPSAVAMMIPVR